MQKDFHYFVIRILSEKAGFSPEEAQTIAYASQYVDDATEHKPIKLPLNFTIEYPRIDGYYFDPVCTAHKGLQFLQDFKKNAQMQIYMCFHFLPEEPYFNQVKYSYLTKANSTFAKLLLTRAKNYFLEKPDERTFNLINLGIALHTYADTWSHHNFSGTHSHRDNNIERIRIWENRRWQILSRAGRFRNKLMPEIGHAEAYHYPDLPFITWRFQRIKDKETFTRNNLDMFIDAAEKIFDFLCQFNDKHKKWTDFADKLIYCLSNADYSLSRRSNFYKVNFPEIGFHYSPVQWKNEVLNKTSKTLAMPLKRNSEDIKWFLFHKAAWEQRKFILNNIKPL